MAFNIHIEDWQVGFTTKVGEPILQAGLAQDIALPHDCQSGYCGQCKVRLIEGVVEQNPDHARFTGIDAADRAEGWMLMCQARASSDLTLRFSSPTVTTPPAIPTAIEPSAAIPPPSKPLQVSSYPAKIIALEALSPEVTGMSIRLPSTPPFHFHAGQYVELQFNLPPIDPPTRPKRAYSIACAPKHFAQTRTLTFHIRHNQGGYFASVLPQLSVGSLLRVYGPSGQFHWQADATPKTTLLVAGGTGFAPVAALLDDLADRAEAVAALRQLPLALYWGVRGAAEIYAPETLIAWHESLPNLKIHLIPSEDATPPEDATLRAWWREKNWVHRAVMAAHPDMGDCRAYVCGAPVMVEAAFHDFQKQGLPLQHFHSDAFIAARTA